VGGDLVGVVGAGTMGSMTLWRLAQRGVPAIGFEQFGAGHDRGAAGGETRIFRTAYLEGPEYVPLLREAHAGWRELERETGVRLLTLTGGLTIGDPGAATMRSVLASITQFGLGHNVLDRDAALVRYPQHRLFPGEAMILEEEAGVLRPELAVLTAIRRAEQLGAVVHRHTRVEAITPTAGGVRIRANGQSHDVGSAVITAGPWTASVLPDWRERLVVQRLVMSWYAADDPSQFAPARFPVFTRRWKGVDLFGLPTVDGCTVKVALNAGAGVVEDPDALDCRVDLEATVTAVVGDLLPGLWPEPVRLATYMDAFTADDHAVIGTLPDIPDAVVLCGFSGHGFKLAPVMGEIAADLVLDGATRHHIDHLALRRLPTVTP
jgi:sarcosine oxidase